MYAVTLKALREARACREGYNKLVRYVQGLPFSLDDEQAERYLHFRCTDSIPLSAVLKAVGFVDALWALRACPEAAKAERLLAVSWARRLQHLMGDKRSLEALHVAEEFAHGRSSVAELTEANKTSGNVYFSDDWERNAELAHGAAWECTWARGSAWSVYVSVSEALEDCAAFAETAEEEFRNLINGGE